MTDAASWTFVCHRDDIVPNTGRAHPLRAALNNAFGFGGINSVLVLSRVD